MAINLLGVVGLPSFFAVGPGSRYPRGLYFTACFVNTPPLCIAYVLQPLTRTWSKLDFVKQDARTVNKKVNICRRTM
jgi:hypothetical protein